MNANRYRYTRTAIALHWVLALALIGIFCVGLYMAGLPLSPSRIRLYNWHKWAGVCILAASLLRLVWRWRNPPPLLPQAVQLTMPPWQRALHNGTHVGMYALFFVVPLLGWAYSSAMGFSITLFGVLPLPDFVPHDKVLGEAIKPWHWISAYTLAALVLLHLAGVVKHAVIDRDGLLERMNPW